jgi:hypothetical protein
LLPVCVLSALQAQSPAAGTPPLTQDAPATTPSPDNAWLARVNKLYYSSAKAGLTGFDCAVHPEWHTLFVSAAKGESVAEDDPRIVLLRTVKITMHARMAMTGSTIDWQPPAATDKPLDESSSALLDGMHRSIQQTLEGFLQFWTPFMTGSVVPDSADGLQITHTGEGHTIHAEQGTTALTEVFSSDLVLKQFNVVMSGTSIKFSPVYKPTDQGLLVNGFVAHIQPDGAPPEQAQEMKVAIEYQPVDGLIIPGHLKMDVAGTGTFDFTFDGCSANPKAN